MKSITREVMNRARASPAGFATQRSRKIAALPDHDPAQPQPRRHRLQFAGQRRGHLRRLLARFGERADDVQYVRCAVRLEIDTADESPSSRNGHT